MLPFVVNTMRKKCVRERWGMVVFTVIDCKRRCGVYGMIFDKTPNSSHTHKFWWVGACATCGLIMDHNDSTP